MFEIVDSNQVPGTTIKVVGVGGAGGNAVDHMIRNGVTGVEFISANTDAQALSRCLAKQQLQLGSTGLGAGAKPEAGRAAALEQRESIREGLAGAHMCFITAGMGGGTGTGAAPVVAEIAREMGVLTVAVVSKPFGFEGKRMRIAEHGIEELGEHVDSLIVILNEKLMDVLGEDVSMKDAFRAADDVLYNAVAGISEIINSPGLVNVGKCVFNSKIENEARERPCRQASRIPKNGRRIVGDADKGAAHSGRPRPDRALAQRGRRR